MKRIIWWLSLTLLIVAVFLYISYEMAHSDVTVVYHLPAGFDGCMYLLYNQPNEEPLKIDDEEIIIKIPDDGIVSTSSSSDVISGLGWHKVKAFYVNKKGERLEEIPNEKFTNGSTSIRNNNPQTEKFSISFDTRNGFCH
ncbi:hypothetical protein QWT69_05145 [Sporosarcina oncorhynchi]|uniref:DUF6843 domain-containing protein n=1 Tax=Sporosarcina oncorhynchi TaxID=3056444 RepID=A0ABZ0L8P2_9BACL|nr:hypothetical protein [Sporosarcina sp. T2O-4]WOV88505.1 hypothetical protein QWT69_05145 [Sporosarcina sp. T2O-4]